MCNILVNGCFDLLHSGHVAFLKAAKTLGYPYNTPHKLIVAVNTDESACRLKSAKWGAGYPVDSLATRIRKLRKYADEVVSFDTEEELHGIVEFFSPCILVKGPDYLDRHATGDDIAPVLILDTPEPETVKVMKEDIYGQKPCSIPSQNL